MVPSNAAPASVQGAPAQSTTVASQAATPNASVVPTPSAPASEGAARPWLSQSGAREPSDAPAPAGTPWRAVLVLAIVLGAGAYAYMWKRRRLSSSLTSRGARLRVLDSARVGPRAHLVLADVGGRTLLLGVTDRSIRRIAFVPQEKEAPTTDAAEAPVVPAAADSAWLPNDAAPARTAELRAPLGVAAAHPPPGDERADESDAESIRPMGVPKDISAAFGDVLQKVLKKSRKPRDTTKHESAAPPEAAALALAAAETRDVVEVRSRRPRAGVKATPQLVTAGAATSPSESTRRETPSPEASRISTTTEAAPLRGYEGQVSGLSRRSGTRRTP
jgi:flagellar biogenesis protein FliO